jgi:cell pole-organizing protein PopZ
MSDIDQDPSIEEILASIRQIISDDEDETPAAADSAEQILEQDDIDEVMELTNRVEDMPTHVSADDLDALFDDPMPVVSDPAPIIEEDIIIDLVEEEEVFADPVAPEVIPEVIPAVIAPIMTESAPQAASQNIPDEILTPIARAAVENAYAALSRNTPIHHAAGTTLEDIVRSLLNPMLRQWLDSHLPPLIEKIVREELGKIAQKNL